MTRPRRRGRTTPTCPRGASPSRLAAGFGFGFGLGLLTLTLSHPNPNPNPNPKPNPNPNQVSLHGGEFAGAASLLRACVHGGEFALGLGLGSP